MFTRKDYMSGKCSHQDFYAQYITMSIRRFVENRYTVEFLRKCYAEDEHLNNLGMNWMNIFDSFTRAIAPELATMNLAIEGSRSYSLSMGTCAIKAYMHIYAGLEKADKETTETGKEAGI